MNNKLESCKEEFSVDIQSQKIYKKTWQRITLKNLTSIILLILLTDLTMNHSDMNKLNYLNVLLLSEFKSKHILGENGLELNEHVFL